MRYGRPGSPALRPTAGARYLVNLLALFSVYFSVYLGSVEGVSVCGEGGAGGRPGSPALGEYFGSGVCGDGGAGGRPGSPAPAEYLCMKACGDGDAGGRPCECLCSDAGEAGRAGSLLMGGDAHFPRRVLLVFPAARARISSVMESERCSDCSCCTITLGRADSECASGEGGHGASTPRTFATASVTSSMLARSSGNPRTTRRCLSFHTSVACSERRCACMAENVWPNRRN